ncbi:MAG: hypothetical protein K6D94_12645, partial [Clostridiales bacterium]|nr:hypothetical protein [Clostridiales bacterium]
VVIIGQDPYMRKALYGFGDGIVHLYTLKPEIVKNKAHYYIRKGDDEYDLLLNSMQIRIFNSEVGLFIMEAENHGLQRDGIRRQDNIEAVKNINDYGRRIALPFIPNSGNGFANICADSLTIKLGNGMEFKSEYMDFAVNLDSEEKIGSKVLLTHIATFIKLLFEYGNDYKFVTCSTSDPDSFYILPAIDDRMYVDCWISDQDAAAAFSQWENDKDVKDSLYELAFFDHSGGMSCKNAAAQERLLREHIYDRWIDDRNIYTITSQGMIGIGGDDCGQSVVDSFLTIYVQMSCLCLVQRASLIHFNQLTSILSASDGNCNIKMPTISKIMNLQESFIAFESQLSFSDVTSQEQGVDIYDMMLKHMMIVRDKESLKETLDALYDASYINLDYRLSKWGGVFAVVTSIFTLPQILYLEDGALRLRPWYLMLWLLAIIAFVIMTYRNRRR